MPEFYIFILYQVFYIRFMKILLDVDNQTVTVIDCDHYIKLEKTMKKLFGQQRALWKIKFKEKEVKSFDRYWESGDTITVDAGNWDIFTTGTTSDGTGTYYLDTGKLSGKLDIDE